jgi:hypothetical protein
MRTNTQHHLMMTSHGGWQKPMRRALILLSVTAAALVVAAPAVQSAQEPAPVPPQSPLYLVKHSSTGKTSPCVPPKASRMEKRESAQGVATRIQRNAGTPSLFYAMALSMALGVRSVAGPVEPTKQRVGKTAERNGTSAGTRNRGSDRYALSVDRAVQCPGRVSMK